MYLNMCWTNTLNAREDKKFISTWWQNPSHTSEDRKCISTCWPNLHLAREDNKCTSICVDLSPHMPARIQHVFWHVMNIPNPCQNISQLVVSKPTHVSKDKKCISTCVHQTTPIPARTQNVSEDVFTPSLKCQRGQKIHLNMWWPNPTHACEDTKCNSTFVDQINAIRARTQNAPKHMMNKSIPWQWRHRIYLKS